MGQVIGGLWSGVGAWVAHRSNVNVEELHPLALPGSADGEFKSKIGPYYCTPY